MREILFRAKRIDNGEWVYGYAFDDGLIESSRMFVGGFVITDYKGSACDRWDVGIDFCEVIPATVGQFTGLLDKNGTKIFEGDIVISHSRSVDENDGPAQIEWDEDTARFIIVWNTLLADFDNFYSHDLEVVGNIHDNEHDNEFEDFKNG